VEPPSSKNFEVTVSRTPIYTVRLHAAHTNWAVSFFNLRSFDRIALTPQRLQHLQQAGLDVVSADVALDMKINGHVKDEHGSNVQVMQTPHGDLQGQIVHPPQKSTTGTSLQDMFGLERNATAADVGKAADSAFDNLTRTEKAPSMIPPTIADHGLLGGGGQDMSEVWTGDQQDAIKNFVSEELYIHTKVHLLLRPGLILAHDC
jgi:hypothetical protein